ncbi:MAG TPA: hypothetical protein PKD00_10805, partial [Burkholderiales bacterium]|nr:hypothetical protein [Burkholderiales bacterium]
QNPEFHPNNDTNQDTIQQLTSINQDPYLNKVTEKDLSKYNIFANKIYYDRSIDLTAAQVGVLLLKVYKYEAFAIYTHYKASQYQTLCPASVPCTGTYEDAIQKLNDLFKARMENVTLISQEAKNYYDLNLYIKGDWFQTLYNVTDDINTFVHNKDYPVLTLDTDGNVIHNNLYSNSLFLRVNKLMPDSSIKTIYTNTRACKNRILRFANTSFQCDGGVDNFDDNFVNYDNGISNDDFLLTFRFDENIHFFNDNFNIISNSSSYPLSMDDKTIYFNSKNARYAYLLSYNDNMFYISNSDGKIFNNIDINCIKYDYNCHLEDLDKLVFQNNIEFKWYDASNSIYAHLYYFTK